MFVGTSLFNYFFFYLTRGDASDGNPVGSIADAGELVSRPKTRTPGLGLVVAHAFRAADPVPFLAYGVELECIGGRRWRC